MFGWGYYMGLQQFNRSQLEHKAQWQEGASQNKGKITKITLCHNETGFVPVRSMQLCP